MKSICIKSNNQKAIEYLLDKLKNLQFDNLYYSCKQFKIYKNIIIHYKGKDELAFFNLISDILTYLIIDIYEEKLIKKITIGEYFYFTQSEMSNIINNTLNALCDDEESIYPRSETIKLLHNVFYEYITEHKSLVLTGFITFRIKKYIEILADQIDKSVNKFIIEREYIEFISLLKMYINTEPNNSEIVHIIYEHSKPILLDENKSIIQIETDIFNAKYLSDISFSSNDYALNTLLTLNPKKIYIHLIDNTVDEFINTLKLIFENKVIYCTDCAICNIYKASAKSKILHP